MANKSAKATAEAELAAAPYGWDVVGEDGRRIDRWQTKADAQTTAARVADATGEKVKLVPSKPRTLGPAAERERE